MPASSYEHSERKLSCRRQAVFGLPTSPGKAKGKATLCDLSVSVVRCFGFSVDFEYRVHYGGTEGKEANAFV